jgi:hypothetical protein
VKSPRRDTRALSARRKGAAPLSGAEEQTARAISANAQYACLLSLQMESINKTRLDGRDGLSEDRGYTSLVLVLEDEALKQKDRSCVTL